MTRGYGLVGSSGGAALTVTSFYGENPFELFRDDKRMNRGFQLDGSAHCDPDHAMEFLELTGKEYW